MVVLSESFEIVKVLELDDSFKVIVEFESRDRKSFVFPLEDEYFEKNSSGEFVFVDRIRGIVGERLFKKSVGRVKSGEVSRDVSSVIGCKVKAKKRDELLFSSCKLGFNASKSLKDEPEKVCDFLDDDDLVLNGLSRDKVKDLRSKSGKSEDFKEK